MAPSVLLVLVHRRQNAMKATSSTHLERLQPGDIHTLARASGPCVTIRVPPFHPGEAVGNRATLLPQLAQKAAAELREFSPSREANEVADVLGDLIQSVDETHGGPGLTIFCAAGVQAALVTPQVSQQIVV